MTILIVLVTTVLILDCLILGLLIIIQLPKKEAGIGMAFGGGAADALFGAGSGTALSNLTKYTATAFFILVFGLSVLYNHAQGGNAKEFKKQFERQTALPAPSPSTTSSTTATPPPSTAMPAIPLTISSNVIAPPPPTTNTNTTATAPK